MTLKAQAVNEHARHLCRMVDIYIKNMIRIVTVKTDYKILITESFVHHLYSQ